MLQPIEGAPVRVDPFVCEHPVDRPPQVLTRDGNALPRPAGIELAAIRERSCFIEQVDVGVQAAAYAFATSCDSSQQ